MERAKFPLRWFFALLVQTKFFTAASENAST